VTVLEQDDTIGPVDVAVLYFEGSKFNGEVAPALLELQESGIVRIIDIALIVKDFDGLATFVELEDADIAEAFDMVDQSLDLLSEEDLAGLAEGLDPGSSAIIVVWENTWAGRLAAAVRGSNGRLVALERIPHDVVLNALAALDQPTMDAINTYFVSWAAKEVGLKVALSGLGGDELFAGYPTFTDTPRFSRLIRTAWFVPGVLRRLIAPLVATLAAQKASPGAGRKAASAWVYPDALPHPYFFTRTLFPPGQLERIIEPRFRPSTVGADGVTLDPTWLGWMEKTAAEARNREPVTGISWLEMRSYMASTLLRDTDAVSMAQSLEVRVPLLDTPLVEFVASLPDAARRRPGTQKALLVEALGDLLPREVLAQRKRTFTLPWEEWLRGPLRARLEASFNEPALPLAAYLRPGGVRGVWIDFLAGKTTWSRPWSLYVLNEWCRRHLAA